MVGGTGAVSDAVASSLQAYTAQPIVRLAGADRYATAAAIAQAFFARPPSAYLATGLNFPDALAAGPAAGRFGSPVLLVRSSPIPAATTSELLRLQPPYTYYVGGSGVLSDGVVAYFTALLDRQ